MHPQARPTLRELRSLTNIETYLKTARAELASDPCDEMGARSLLSLRRC